MQTRREMQLRCIAGTSPFRVSTRLCFVELWSIYRTSLSLGQAWLNQSQESDKNCNTLWSRPNGRHFADDIFKRIFLNESTWILIKISLKLVPKDPIHNIPGAVQATSHYLNQWWLGYRRIYASLGLNELTWNNLIMQFITVASHECHGV